MPELNLTEKIGPLPAYAWGGIIGVGVVGLAYARRSSGAAKAAVDTGAYSGVVSDTATGFPILTPGTVQAAAVQTGTTSGATSAATVPDFLTNGMWLSRTLAALTTNGESPLVVQVALEKYLNGKSLSANEQNIVDKGLSKNGLPPDGTAEIPSFDNPVVITPAPVAPVTVAPVTSTVTPTAPVTPAPPVQAAPVPVTRVSPSPTPIIIPDAAPVPATAQNQASVNPQTNTPVAVVTPVDMTPGLFATIDSIAGQLLGNGSYNSGLDASGNRYYVDSRQNRYSAADITQIFNMGLRDINGQSKVGTFITSGAETIGSLARQFYGADTAANRARITGANGYNSSMSALGAGTRVKIPYN